MQEIFVSITLIPIITLLACNVWLYRKYQTFSLEQKNTAWAGIGGKPFWIVAIFYPISATGITLTWFLYAIYPVDPTIAMAFAISCLALALYDVVLYYDVEPKQEQNNSAKQARIFTPLLSILAILIIVFACYVSIAAKFAIDFELQCVGTNSLGVDCTLIQIVFAFDVAAAFISSAFDICIWYVFYYSKRTLDTNPAV